jgi:ferritin
VAFQDAYDHECLISRKINDLVDLATEQKDHAATTFLQWLVTEQVEEEATTLSIVEKLKLIGDNSMGILMMDQQLAGRTVEPAE